MLVDYARFMTIRQYSKHYHTQYYINYYTQNNMMITFQQVDRQVEI